MELESVATVILALVFFVFLVRYISTHADTGETSVQELIEAANNSGKATGIFVPKADMDLLEIFQASYDSCGESPLDFQGEFELRNGKQYKIEAWKQDISVCVRVTDLGWKA